MSLFTRFVEVLFIVCSKPIDECRFRFYKQARYEQGNKGKFNVR